MPILAGSFLTPGVKSSFYQAWEDGYKGVQNVLGSIMWLDAPSDGLYEIYAIWNTTPYPVRWDRGTIISNDAMGSIQFTVYNRNWGSRIYWHEDDERDDRTGTLLSRARALGEHWATLDERVFFQFIQAGTDADLLPAVPNSADGVALYSASTRFGSSNGNQVAESGTSTVQQIITDTVAVVRRFNEFQNTESQPFWNMSETMDLTVFYDPEVLLVHQQAYTAMGVFGYQAGTSTTDTSTAAGIDNVLQTAGFKIRPVVNQRITDTGRYFFINNLPNWKRPLFKQLREGQSMAEANWATSDHVRDTGEKYIQFKSRFAFGSPIPIGTIRLT